MRGWSPNQIFNYTLSFAQGQSAYFWCTTILPRLSSRSMSDLFRGPFRRVRFTIARMRETTPTKSNVDSDTDRVSRDVCHESRFAYSAIAELCQPTEIGQRRKPPIRRAKQLQEQTTFSSFNLMMLVLFYKILGSYFLMHELNVWSIICTSSGRQSRANLGITA